MDNWLLIIVFVVVLLCVVMGAVRGFFKIGISLVATVLTVFLMILINPLVTGALINLTPLDSAIEGQVKQLFIPELTVEEIAQLDLSNTPLADMTAEQIANYTANIGEINLELYGITEADILETLGDVPAHLQQSLIEAAPVSHFLQTRLIENNTADIRAELGAETFPQYIASYVARMVLRIVSFLVTFVLAIIIVKAIIVAVDILGELPVVGLFNRLGGAIVGGGVSVVFIWLGFLVIALLYSTSFGLALYRQVEANSLLSFLYNNNLIMNRLLDF